jgi:hypothetical protein
MAVELYTIARLAVEEINVLGLGRILAGCG